MVKPKVVALFAEMIKEFGMDFMVVGSEALRVCGLEIDPHDLDVEVICPPEKEMVFKALADAEGNNFYKEKESYPDAGWEHKPFIFRFKDELVNVWVVKKFTHETFVYKDYVKYAGVMGVLKQKMKLGRKKDQLFLINLINQLTKL